MSASCARNEQSHQPVPSISPLRLAADCEMLSAVMHVLTLVGTEKLTARQVLFFLAAAYLDLRGTPASPTQLREIYGTLGRSIEKSKDQLLTKTKQNPDALEWLVAEQDEDDRRYKYLRLTLKGRQVIESVSTALAI